MALQLRGKRYAPDLLGKFGEDSEWCCSGKSRWPWQEILGWLVDSNRADTALAVMSPADYNTVYCKGMILGCCSCDAGGKYKGPGISV
jgi:hypothetical protein